MKKVELFGMDFLFVRLVYPFGRSLGTPKNYSDGDILEEIVIPQYFVNPWPAVEVFFTDVRPEFPFSTSEQKHPVPYIFYFLLVF